MRRAAGLDPVVQPVCSVGADRPVDKIDGDSSSGTFEQEGSVASQS
jgi:hypothetical protein